MSGQSQHHPLHAGESVTVTGSLTIDTGLRDVQSFVAKLESQPVAGAAYLGWTLDKTGPTVLVTMSVESSVFAASVVAATVSWLALAA